MASPTAPLLATLIACAALAFLAVAQQRERSDLLERRIAAEREIVRQESEPDRVISRETRSLRGVPLECVEVVSQGWHLRDCIRPGDPLPTRRGQASAQSGFPTVDAANIARRQGVARENHW